MPSREVLSQLSRSEPDVTGLGPVQDTNDYVPQGLLEMHHKLAAKPNSSVHRTPAPSDTGKLQASQASHEICARGDRVRSTGARSPGSLAAEIEAQIKRVADKKARNKEQGNQDQGNLEIKKG